MEDSICAVWFARCLASVSACRLMERSQVRCGLVVKRVRRRREMRWCFEVLEVVSSVVAGEIGVVVLMLISLLRRQRLRPQCLLPVGGLVRVWC